jgi:hypothetical protein
MSLMQVVMPSALSLLSGLLLFLMLSGVVIVSVVAAGTVVSVVVVDKLV